MKTCSRFVRSLARGLQAYLRNLPTLIAIVAHLEVDKAHLPVSLWETSPSQ